VTHFPICWSHPGKFTSMSDGVLSVEETRLVELIRQLPQPIEVKELLYVLDVEDPSAFMGKVGD